MRRLLFYIIMIVCGYFLQTGVFTSFTLGGIVPNILIICTVSTGMVRGKKDGCILGFILGILMDALYGSFFGVYALFLSVMGYVAGKIKQYFYEEDMTLPLVIIGIVDLLYGILIFVFGFFPRGRTNFLFYLSKIILPELFYTLILAIFLYRLIVLLNKKIDKGSENRID